ncbi:type III-A CRISPR-associated protein Csm2, partial [Bellilinea sp.]
MSPIPANEVQKIITQDASGELLVQTADQFGKELKDLSLSTSQIRSLFGEVRQI